MTIEIETKLLPLDPIIYGHPVSARGMAVTYFELFVNSLLFYPFFDALLLCMTVNFQVHDWEFSLYFYDVILSLILVPVHIVTLDSKRPSKLPLCAATQSSYASDSFHRNEGMEGRDRARWRLVSRVEA